MKKINKYLVAAFAAVLSAGLFSCVEEAPEYTPGEADVEGVYGVYFPTQAAAGDHTFDPTMDKVITVTAARTNTKGEITVPIVVDDPEGIYQIEPIVFADGQTETTFNVSFPDAETAVKYPLTLIVKESPYCAVYQDNPTSISLSAFCVEWRYFAVDADGKETYSTTEDGATLIHWTQDWWGEEATGYVKYYEVNGVRHAVTVTKTHATEDGPYEGYGFFGTGEKEGEFEWEFGWYPNMKNSIDGQYLDLYDVNTGYHYNDGEVEADVHAYDYRGYWNEINSNHYGFTFEEFAPKYGDIKTGNYPLGYYDGNGGFYFFIEYYYMIGIGGWEIDDIDVVGIADGFTRVDYSIEAESDFTVDGVVPVYVEAGNDVAEIKYACVLGELGAKEIAAVVEGIEAGTQENVASFTELTPNEEGKKLEGAFGITLDQTAFYTCVLVAYDKDGVAQNSTSVVLNYVSAEDTETYDFNIVCVTEDTPARYTQLDAIHSFAYYVAGEGLTEVHIASVATDKYQKDVEVYNDAIKYDVDPVSEEVLALINQDGGYYALQTGLSAATSYTILVWATNGYEDKIITAEYTTAEDPETWHALGTGSFTEDMMTTFFNVENVTYEVQVEESDREAGRYRVVNPYGAAYPYNDEGDWDASKDYYIIFNAQDPTRVWIPECNTGMDWGYGSVLIYSYAAYYMDNGYSADVVAQNDLFGTLADGVITFPEKAILIQMPNYKQTWSLSNVNAAFKLILPSAYNGGTAAPAMRVNASKAAQGGEACKTIVSILEREYKGVAFKTSPVAPKQAVNGKDVKISVAKNEEIKF